MFLGYIHSFRALAIFLIVAGHSIDAFIWENAEETERLLRIFISNGSVLFVFIAGYLFQHLSEKYETKKYYLTKLKNVVLPYIIVSIPAIIVFTFILERESVWNEFYNNPIWMQIILFYMTGKHLAPLWFIPMIVIFYAIAPILINADKNASIYYFLPVFIIISCFFGRGLPHESFVHFFSIYLLGMACSKYKTSLNPTLSKTTTLSILLSFIFLFGILEFTTTQETMSYLNYLQKMIMSLFFLGLFYKFNSKLHFKFISTIANTSFGIFFIHSYFLTAIKLIYEQLFTKLPSGSLFGYSLVAITTLISCIYLIILIQRLFGKYSKFLIGS
jgi:membrane-bound acyltransferase YfiQ involved in biofilm formation